MLTNGNKREAIRMENVQSKVSAAILQTGAEVVVQGKARNRFVFERRSDFFEVGKLLFDWGLILERPVEHAKRFGVSKQAVEHWVNRDAKRVAIIFQTDRWSLLIVDDHQPDLL